MKAIAIALVLALGADAWADGDAPSFVTLDRIDGVSRSGVEVSYVHLDGSSATWMAFDGHVEWVDPSSGLGVYAVAPVWYASGDGSSTTQTGDLELGAIATRQHDGDGVPAHVGITLPTGGSDAAVGFIAAGARMTDDVLGIPGGVTLRLGVSPELRDDQLFARVDLGLDVPLSSRNGSHYTTAHASLGVGLDEGPIAFMAELTNLIVMGDQATYAIDRGAIAVRATGHVEPYAALTIPLDDDARIFGTVITAGVDVTAR